MLPAVPMLGLPAIGAWEIAQLRREFPRSGIGELVEMFQEEGPEALAKIYAAVEARHPDRLRRAVHALKGGCSNFGAHPLEALCQQIEDLARSGSAAVPEEWLTALQAEYERVEQALQREREND